MDLLFKRYANPFLLLDQYISMGRLYDFVIGLMDIVREEQDWEFYLHRVFDISYEEFKNRIHNSNKTIDKKEAETTVKKSFQILNNFEPPEE